MLSSQPEYDLPGYAQPTASSIKLSTPKKRGSREQTRCQMPMSLRLQGQKSPGKNVSKIATRPSRYPSNVDDTYVISATNSRIAGPRTGTNYVSPKLVRPMLMRSSAVKTAPRKSLKALISETDSLLQQLSKHPLEEIFSCELEKFERKQLITMEDWQSLICYHKEIMAKVMANIDLDHELIQHVLELNNAISAPVSDIDP